MINADRMLPDEEVVTCIEQAMIRYGSQFWPQVRPALLAGEARMLWNERGVWFVEVPPANPRVLSCLVVGREPANNDEPQVMSLAKAMELHSEVEAYAIALGLKGMIIHVLFPWSQNLPTSLTMGIA